MKIKLFILAMMAMLGFGLAFAAPSQAQATRTWVSGVGDDVNPCSRTAPCKTFAGAISKTSAGGEINCLDSGGFGTVTITKSISIICTGVEAGVLATGGINGFIVTTGATNVVLEGLDIQGIGSVPGVNGVRIVTNASVVIRNCRIHAFSNNGVDLAGPAGAKVLVQDSVISNNAIGVSVQGTSGAANTAVVDNSTLETHSTAAIQVATGGAVFVSKSNLIGSGQKMKLTGGVSTSYGNNVIRGTSDAFTTTLPLQ
jgi:hypothetical protein